MKRMRADTASSAVQAMVDASMGAPEVPAHVALRDGDLPFWYAIVRARARSDWTENDLTVAAQLARCQADIEREQKQVDAENTVLLNERGTMVANPRVAVLEQLSRRQMALMRSLRMGGVASGAAEDDAKRRKIQRKAEEALEQIGDEDLLAA